MAAGVSEVAVPVLSNWLYPGKDKADYTAEEKQTLSAIAGMLSAGGTLAAGGSATDAAAANVAAMNAVENNRFAASRARGLELIVIPAFGALYCSLDKRCENVTGTFVGMLNDLLEENERIKLEEQRELERIKNSVWISSSNSDDRLDSRTSKSNQGAAAGAPMPPDPDDERFKNLSTSDKRAIRSLERQIKTHREKIIEFQNNPTTRPGMEHLPEEIIKKQHQRRIEHLEREIKAFEKGINDILKKGK